MTFMVNVAVNHMPLVAWDGTNSYARDTRPYVQYGWGVEVVTDVTADAVFRIESALPSAADDCLPDTWSDVPEVQICDTPEMPSTETLLTIPAGSVAGTCLAATLPCKAGPFVRMVPVSGDTANVRASMVLVGRKMPRKTLAEVRQFGGYPD